MCSQNAGNVNVISEPLILKFFQGACLWTSLEVTKYDPPNTKQKHYNYDRFDFKRN